MLGCRRVDGAMGAGATADVAVRTEVDLALAVGVHRKPS
jgi:hypothetical protein